jgi:hypothetical protein
MTKQKAGRGRPPGQDKSFRTLGYRFSESYPEWINKAAAANRSTVSGLIDQGVSPYARAINVSDAPPDRTA